MSKSPDAFRTISEVAEWLGVQAHVLRFWESKFTQVKPVKRAGGRRYYRPADMQLLGGIKKLLHDDGLPIKEVQALLREHGAAHVAGFSHPLDAAAEERPADVPPADKLGDDWQSSLDLTPEPDAQDAAFPAADGGNVVGFPQPPAAQGPRPGSPAEGAAPQMRMDLDAPAAQEPAAAGDTPEPAADAAAGAGPASPWQDSPRDDAPEDGALPPEASPAAARDTAPEPAEAPAQEPLPADGLLPPAPPPAAAEAEPSPDAAPAEDDGAEPAAEAPPAFAPESEPAAVQDPRPAAAEAAAEPADRADRPDAGPGQDLAPAPAAAADPDPAAEQPAPEPADTEAGPEPADEPLLEAELAPLGEHGPEPLADTGTESGPFADPEPLAETAPATGPAPADTPGAAAEPVAVDAPDLAGPDSAPEAEPAAAQDTLVAAAGLQPEEPLDFGSPADPLAGHPPHGQADGAQDALEDALEDPAADPAASFPPHDLDAAARQVDALEFASGFNGPGGAQPAPEAAEAAPEGPEAADPEAAEPEAAEPEAEEAPAAAPPAPHPGILAHLAAIRSLPPQSVAAIQACAEELRALASNR